MSTALACGRVAKASGEVLIGKVISHSFEKDSSYHKPIRKVTSRDDVEYDPNLMLRARRAIAGHVKSEHPVLVGCAFDPKTSMLKDGHLQATRDGGHTVLIVGCNEDEAATEFLYVDPYPGGSTLKYKGRLPRHYWPISTSITSSTSGQTDGESAMPEVRSLSCATPMTSSWASSMRVKPDASWQICGSEWKSSRYRCIRKRHA
jgi:hypothetical protein